MDLVSVEANTYPSDARTRSLSCMNPPDIVHSVNGPDDVRGATAIAGGSIGLPGVTRGVTVAVVGTRLEVVGDTLCTTGMRP